MTKEIRPTLFKRVLALIIDFIILGLLGSFLGLFLEDFFVSLGRYGTLFGSAIVIMYFGILQSHVGRGQSIGKKILKAKVVDIEGNFLTLKHSVFRSFIVFFPLMNIEVFSGGGAIMLIWILFSIIALATFYFVLVNNSNRGMHDILINSIVLNQDIDSVKFDAYADKRSKKLIPMGIIAALVVVTGFYLSFSENIFSQLLTAKAKIEAEEGVIGVNEIKSNTTTHSETGKSPVTYSSVSVSVRIKDKAEVSNKESKLYTDFYQIIKNEIPEANEVNQVIITLYYGYNIGIANKTYSITKAFEN